MIAALFPGQGAQKVGMGDEFLREFSVARQVFEEASDTLGFDMKQLCLEGPSEDLQLTENTQPALLTMSIASLSIAKEKFDLSIKAGAGHSVGEYATLVAAGVFPFSKGLELVKLRGQLMQKAVPIGEGGMLAVMGLDPEEVDDLCRWATKETGDSPLEPANYNSPGQIVISGRSNLIEFVSKNFKPEKIQSKKTKVRLIPLKVSAPFHCSMMKEAENEMKGAIDEVDFYKPQFGVVQNYTGRVETSPEELKKNLILQISGAVRWVECMETLKDLGLKFCVEFGPGSVLTGLAKKIDGDYFRGIPLGNCSDLTVLEEKLLDF